MIFGGFVKKNLFLVKLEMIVTYLFFEKLIAKMNEKLKFDIIPKTNKKFISVTYGCIRFIDSYRLLSSSLDLLVKLLVIDDFEILKKLISDIWEDLKKTLAHPYEYF